MLGKHLPTKLYPKPSVFANSSTQVKLGTKRGLVQVKLLQKHDCLNLQYAFYQTNSIFIQKGFSKETKQEIKNKTKGQCSQKFTSGKS